MTENEKIINDKDNINKNLIIKDIIIKSSINNQISSNNTHKFKITENLFLYNQLRNKVTNLNKENTELKSKLSSLQDKVTNLESEKIIQNKTILELNKSQNSILYLKQIISEKEEVIKKLEDQILTDHRKFNEEYRNREKKFDYDLIQSKIQYDSAKYKIENYLKVENYNDALYKKMIEMEEIIHNFNKIEEDNMNKKKIEYTNKLNKFKKKVIDFLREEVNTKEDFKEQMRITNMTNNLHIQELIRDIENLNYEVIELLDEKQELKYKIFCLVNDIKIYRKVIDTVCLKNNHLQKKLFKKNMSSPMMKFKKFFADKKPQNINVDNSNDKELICPTVKINKKLAKISNSLSSIFEKSKKTSNINIKNESLNSFNSDNYSSLNKFNSTSYFNPPKIDFKSINSKKEFKNKKLYILIDEQIELIKEKERYKKYYEFYKEKVFLMKEKYSSIFKIYNEALEKIYNEDLPKDNNNIFINISELKNGNFDFTKMNSEEKYFILIKLIKHISPLVLKEDIENNTFVEQVFNVKEKYALRNNTKSFNSSTEQNSFDISSKIKNKKNVHNFEKKNRTLNEFNKTNNIKIGEPKHRNFSNMFRNNKNKHKIYMELKYNFNVLPDTPLKSIPINDFYNGPFSSI